MDRIITVQQPDAKAAPWAAVPSKYVWDLVEYLACQRTRVHYTYGAAQFYVRFLRLDQPAAQRILDRWAQSESEVPPDGGLVEGASREALMSSS